jgi:manganese/zinc/iron transport system permease protein
MLAVHLLQHQDLPPGSYENHVDHCYKHLNWSLPFAERVIGMAKENRLLTEKEGYLALTNTGRDAAQQALTQS